MQKTYVTDTTVWIDYFNLNGVDREHRQNVKKWVDSTIADPDSVILVSTVVILEIIRRMHYVKRSIHTVVNTLERLPYEKPCHIGELSVIPQLTFMETIAVSSDGNALSACKFSIRLNPRFPDSLMPAGTELK